MYLPYFGQDLESKKKVVGILAQVCNESLTPLRGKIHRSLLSARREKKIDTVYSRGGQVFFNREKYAAGERESGVSGKLSHLGFPLQEDSLPRASRDE